MLLFDCHTHSAQAPFPSIVNHFVGDETFPEVDNYLSIGMHPLSLREENFQSSLQEIEKGIQSYPNVIAVGEVGLDKRSAYPLEKQREYLEEIVKIAERYYLPLILHCVKAHNELIEIRKRHPSLPWILHGFRGKEIFAQQMRKFDFLFSFGRVPKYPLPFFQQNPYFFLETDENSGTLLQTYKDFARMLSLDVDEFSQQILQNVKEVFGLTF